MKARYPLFAKILFWFFLNLVVLGVVLVGVFNLQFRLDLRSSLLGDSENRIEAIGRLISPDLNNAAADQWDAILDRYSQAYQVDFVLTARNGTVLAGKHVTIPPKVIEKMRGMRGHRRMMGRGGYGMHREGPPPAGDFPFPPAFRERTTGPTQYWLGIPMPIMGDGSRPPIPAVLLAVSDSLTGSGMFFDPWPWAALAAVIIVLSALLWIPLVRSITRPLAAAAAATGEIALGRFDVKLDDTRRDEIGQLGRSINEMAERLGGFVKGQKRFLGDVAHELASPIARIQLGLGILEQRSEGDANRRVQDVIEEVRQLSDLVNELLSFSRAEVNPGKVQLQNVPVKPIVQRVLEREKPENIAIDLAVSDDLEAYADPELLARALANLVRNAVRYAGEAGPIEIVATNAGDQITLEVRDKGPGVPEPMLGQLFEPFYRPDISRGRETGGVGLGLAIVKTCVQACQGAVDARNLKPQGFAVTIRLKRA